MQDDELPSELESELHNLPVFPLPDVVLFPRVLLPLHVFEPRYRAMVTHCLETHRGLVIARLAKNGAVDDEGRPRFERVAGLGLVVQHHGLADGRSNIVVHGKARVSLTELPSSDPFRRVRATLLRDEGEPVPEVERGHLLSLAASYTAELQKGDGPDFVFPPNTDAGVAADLCAAHLVHDADVRQSLLEETHVAPRVRRVIAELLLQRHAFRRDKSGEGAGKSGRSALN